MVKISKPYTDIKYVALSFLLGFFIRLIPETMYLNYPVGYDVAIYGYIIPNIHKTPIATMLRGTPLFYLASWALLQLTHADIYLLLKIMGPLMYGLLLASFHTLLTSALKWDPKKSLLCTSVCMLQIPTLRLSWDLFRNELGLIMLFLFIVAVNSDIKRKWLITFITAFLTALSHELATILMFVCVLYWMATAKRRDAMLKTAIAILPAALLFSYQLSAYFGLLPPAPQSRPERTIVYLKSIAIEKTLPRPFRNYYLDSLLPDTYTGMLFEFFRMLGVFYLPLLPLAVLGFKRNRVLDPITGWLTLTVFSFPFCPQAYPFYSFFRWALFIVFPMSVYATEGLLKLKSKITYWKPILTAALTVYLFIGLNYASGLVPMPTVYMTRGTLTSSTIEMNRIDDCIACLQWLNQHAGNNSILITEKRFYAWALNFLDKRIAIAYYPPAYPIQDTPLSELTGNFEEIYLIWYAESQPTGFKEVYRSGDIAIYIYEPSQNELN